jgi:hypothetical protein
MKNHFSSLAGFGLPSWPVAESARPAPSAPPRSLLRYWAGSLVPPAPRPCRSRVDAPCPRPRQSARAAWRPCDGELAARRPRPTIPPARAYSKRPGRSFSPPTLTLATPLFPLSKNPSGRTARHSELRLRRRVPATPAHHRSIACARSSAALFPPPNKCHHPLARSGRAQFPAPAAPPRTEPPRSRSGHRRLRPSPSLSNCAFVFTLSPRWWCAPRLVRSRPEAAAGRRRPSHRRGPERRLGLASSPPAREWVGRLWAGLFQRGWPVFLSRTRAGRTVVTGRPVPTGLAR